MDKEKAIVSRVKLEDWIDETQGPVGMDGKKFLRVGYVTPLMLERHAVGLITWKGQTLDALISSLRYFADILESDLAENIDRAPVDEEEE